MKLYETITKENWRKDSTGCLIWHLLPEDGYSTSDRVLGSPAYSRLKEAIRLLFPERVGDADAAVVPIFNDHPDTTVEDVIRVCKLADV